MTQPPCHPTKSVGLGPPRYTRRFRMVANQKCVCVCVCVCFSSAIFYRALLQKRPINLMASAIFYRDVKDGRRHQQKRPINFVYHLLQGPSTYVSHLPSFPGLFCKRDLSIWGVFEQFMSHIIWHSYYLIWHDSMCLTYHSLMCPINHALFSFLRMSVSRIDKSKIE